MGWMSNPQSVGDARWWADLLQRKFLLVVQAYVVGEAYLEGSHGDAAITKDLLMNSPSLTADNLRFPPVKAESDIDLEYLGRNPFHVFSASDGEKVPSTSGRTMTFTDLANDGARPLDQEPEPPAIIPELLRDLNNRAQQKAEEEHQELIGARAEDRAIEIDEGIATILPPSPPPLNVESSILQPPPQYSPPSYYMDELGNQYARTNLWGKSQIHLQLSDQEKRRLDTLNFQIYSRIEKIGEEAAAVRDEIAVMRQKHQVLRDLYKKHAVELDLLEKEQATLKLEAERKHEESRQLLHAAYSRKGTASVAGRAGGGRAKSQKIIGPGRLQNSVPQGKQSAPVIPPNPYAVASGEVGVMAQVCN